MLTYNETLMWVYWLRTFTPSMLADSMGVTTEAIEDFIVGMQRRGTIEDTGDRINGTGPEEPIYGFVPLPPGPTHHPHKPPEWQATPGVGELAPRNRGLPVRIRSERDMRKILSTSGARSKHVQREKRYERMLEMQAQKNRAKERRRQAKLQYRDIEDE